MVSIRQKYYFTEAELKSLTDAYVALTRIGQETASENDEWDPNIDLAHHNLAIAMMFGGALNLAERAAEELGIL